MRFRPVIILFAAFAFASLVSCKEEEKTKEYMTGNISVKHEMPPYVKKGDKYSFTPSGVTAPDGTAVGYYFSAFGKTDTLKNGATSWVLEIPDTLGTFSLSCAAFPVESSDKYYNTTGYISFGVVSDDETNGSITNIGRHIGDTKVYIDGRLFYSFKAGGKDWLRGNLCTIRRDDNGKEVFGRSYAGSPAMQNVFGAYYTWEEAQTACPTGWHLPTESEWIELLKEAGAPEGLKVLESSPCGAGKLMTKAYFNGAMVTLVIGPNGNTLYMPLDCQYWSRTLHKNYTDWACGMAIISGSWSAQIVNVARCFDLQVRAVRVSQE